MSETTIQICSKIAKKSRSVMSIGTKKRRSIANKTLDSDASYSSHKYHGRHISNPKNPQVFY